MSRDLDSSVLHDGAKGQYFYAAKSQSFNAVSILGRLV